MNDEKRMKRIINTGLRSYKKLDNYNSNSDVLEELCECNSCPLKKTIMTYEEWKNKMEGVLRYAKINKYNLLHLLQCRLKNAQIWEEILKVVVIPIYLALLFGEDSLFKTFLASTSEAIIRPIVIIIISMILLISIYYIFFSIIKNNLNYYSELIGMVKKDINKDK